MSLRSFCARLGDDLRGLAMLEFAFSLPIFLTMSLAGAELTNYIVTRMRVSQIALQVADNAARIGSGSQLEAKKISEADINDLLTGSAIQSGELGLMAHGRVIISSLEPDPDHAGKFKIRWQRCAGAKTDHVSRYGEEDDDNLTGIGPAPQITAPDDGVTMFVEVYLEYQPLIKTSLSPSSSMQETASMMVRDRRDTSDGTRHPKGVYIVDGVAASTC